LPVFLIILFIRCLITFETIASDLGELMINAIENCYLVKMKRFIIVPIIVFLLFSCQNSNNTVESKESIKEEEPYFRPDYHYAQQTPDSLRTPEQHVLLKKLSIVLYENLAVKDNKMVFNLSEKEFVAKGIPVEYYKLIQKDLVNNNKHIKENNILNVDSILKESNKQIKKSIDLQ